MLIQKIRACFQCPGLFVVRLIPAFGIAWFFIAVNAGMSNISGECELKFCDSSGFDKLCQKFPVYSLIILSFMSKKDTKSCVSDRSISHKSIF